MLSRRNGEDRADSRGTDIRTCPLSRERSPCRMGLAMLALSTPLLLASCGAELYEQRLENTKKLFARMEMLDSQLHHDWSDNSVGIRLRLPIQFAEIAGRAATPAPSSGAAKGAEAASSPVPHDDRQPDFMNIELPGLRGAFVAKLKFISASSALHDEKGYIYVLTNHHLASAGDRLKAFHKDVVTLLSQNLKVGVKPDDWRPVTFPLAVGSFAEPVSYKTVALNPTELISGVERHFTLYLHEQGSIQTVVLFVLPKDVDGSERLTDRIPLCLETLRVTGDKPVAPTKSSGSPKPNAVGF
jgi:hypothetical protein